MRLAPHKIADQMTCGVLSQLIMELLDVLTRKQDE